MNGCRGCAFPRPFGTHSKFIESLAVQNRKTSVCSLSTNHSIRAKQNPMRAMANVYRVTLNISRRCCFDNFIPPVQQYRVSFFISQCLCVCVCRYYMHIQRLPLFLITNSTLIPMKSYQSICSLIVHPRFIYMISFDSIPLLLFFFLRDAKCMFICCLCVPEYIACHL